MAAAEPTVSADQKFALIELVRARPILYDVSRKDYHDHAKKSEVWRKIAENEGVQLNGKHPSISISIPRLP